MDQKEFEARLADAEVRLKRLRSLYDQWFHGLERLEPQQQKKEVDDLITLLRRNQPQNTALRFRFTQIAQRYTTYNTYWRRITRQIEEGTYKRDVLRARRIREQQAEREQPKRQDAYELDMDIDVDAALEEAMTSDAVPLGTRPRPNSSSHPPPQGERRGASKEITPFAHPSDKPPRQGVARDGSGMRSFPAPPGARPVPPPPPKGAAGGPRRPAPPPVPNAVRRPAAGGSAAAGGGNVSDAQIQQLYKRYVEARRKNGERVDNVKVESVARSVRGMLPKLEKKHAGKKIEFQLVKRNGKVALKPVAK
ncbi:MAG: MXAN_5187 C-terminal domain-containing protein [Myxococcales bacterium]|jgi:hypothetical protein